MTASMTQIIFGAFLSAKITVAASWAPSGGGATQLADVLLGMPDELLDMDQLSVQSRGYQIEYPATSLIGLTAGEPITVDGAAYIVRSQPMAVSDGTIMRTMLSKV